MCLQIKEKTYFIDLFSGIGGFALAAYWAGLRFDGHYFSEVDPYCVELYKKRFPNAIVLGDVTKIDYSSLPKGDYLVCGGFPCQPHSLRRYKRGGVYDKRDLWPECYRILREIQPKIGLFENVPGVFTSNDGKFFNRILSDIFKSGYDAEWEVISAAEIGAPHKRERVWIVAYPKGERHNSNAFQKRKYTEKNRYKPEEWKQLLSISGGKYKIQHWEDHEQIITGTYDGIPEELDAIKGAGNAVVPQCVEMIFNLPVFDRWRIGDN